jgi:two-component system cell cycle response regulator CpdR
LVEDEPIILAVTEAELSEAGFKVVGHSKSANALVELESDIGKFSALVPDIDLGALPDGWQFACKARELSPNIVVIYAGGRRAIDLPHEGVPNSIMLQKPFAAAQLITALALKLNQGTSDSSIWSSGNDQHSTTDNSGDV